MRIAIAHHDSSTRQLLRQALLMQPDIQICWEASTLGNTLEKVSHIRPDTLLLDIHLDDHNGNISAAVQTIMKDHACPVLLITSSIHEQAGRLFDALGAGAADVAAITPSDISLNANDLEQLTRKLNTIRLLYTDRHTSNYATGISTETRYTPLIAIGASTGGPAVLATILSGLPADLDAAIVVVQHVDVEFSLGLANWLNSQCALTVRTARNNDSIECGNIYLAASEDHLILKAGRKLAYTPDPEDYVYRPSVDVFFNSLSDNWKDPAMAILLTGMGRDGCRGMGSLHDNNVSTIAQTSSSCTVFGMPKAAINAGVVDHILDPDEITQAIKQFVRDCHTSRQTIPVKLA